MDPVRVGVAESGEERVDAAPAVFTTGVHKHGLGSDASARSSARRPHRPQFFDGIKVYVRLHTSIARLYEYVFIYILIFIKCREVVFVIFEE